MNNKILIIIATMIISSCIAYAHESFFGKTETNYWDSSKAKNGFTLFGVGGKTYLIDMEGKIVNSWKIGTNPKLTSGGTIVDAAGGDPSKSTTWLELDWNGNTVWTYTEKRSNYAPHHDFEKIYNPKLGDSTFIYIANKSLTLQQCLDAGADTTQTKGYSTAQVDVIVEVDMNGNVIWEWWFFDHIVQDLYPNKANFGVVRDTPGRININLRGNTLKSDWLHCNSLDYNQDLDLVVINSVHGEFYIIDHGNTFIKGDPQGSIELAASSAGDFLYRFGDPAKYNQGDIPAVMENWEKASPGHKQLGGSHNIQWIKKGLPGEGNLLVFNNGQNLYELTPQSYIVEINPYLNSSGVNTGKFVNPPLAGYISVGSPDKDLMKEKRNISKQIVWNYSSKNNANFFATIGSSAQRLPNGNTLVCSDNNGHFFEIYPKDTSVVWEYINPLTKKGIKKVITENYPMYNSAFRAYRYSVDYPGFQGKDLTSKSTITGELPEYYTPESVVSKVYDYNSDDPEFQESNLNFPNPMIFETKIKLNLFESQLIEISIFSFDGLLVKTLLDDYLGNGEHLIIWDGTNNLGENVSGGTYYYSITTKDSISNGKMILIR